MTALPLVVEDPACALALAIVGIEPIRMENRYRKEYLLEKGFDVEKMGPVPAVLAAIERGIAGNKRLFFYNPTPVLTECLTAYFDQKRINEANQTAEIELTSAPEAMRLIRCTLDRRKPHHNLWRQMQAYYWEVKGSGSVVKDPGTTLSGTNEKGESVKIEGVGAIHELPGEILISVNLPDHIRKNMPV